jgi:predicted nucleic acid-binding protein
MRSVAIDAGPLLLMAVGIEFVDTHKRTCTYGKYGYIAVSEFISQFSNVYVTPHVLTEAWNLSGSDETRDPASRHLKLRLHYLIDKFVELFEPASAMKLDPDFIRLGFSDLALLTAATNKACPLVTQDRKLWAAANQRTIPAFHVEDLIKLSPRIASASSRPRRKPR